MSEPTDAPLRYTREIIPGAAFALLRHPVGMEPADGTVAIVTGDDWQTAGIFRDGEWRTQSGKPFARPVRFWTIPDLSDHG